MAMDPNSPFVDDVSPEKSFLNLEALESWINNTIQKERVVSSALSNKQPQVQIIERVVYKKQRVHWFFRTLTIIALVIVGFLMLMESLNIFSLDIHGFPLRMIYPVFIIFSSIVLWSYRGLFGKIFGLILFLTVVVGSFSIWVYSSLHPSTAIKIGTPVFYPMFSGSEYTKLYINTLVSDLTINGVKTTKFLEGNYWSDRNLLIFSGAKDNFQYYSLSEETNLNLLQNYYSVVSFGVNSTQDLYLYIKNFIALQKLDLSTTKTKTVKIHAAGILSDIVVAPGMSSLEIESALADVTVHLPKDVWVKLTYKHLLGKTSLDWFEQKWPGYFESQNIAEAKTIITINMRLGLAKVAFLWDK
jgi:hypothetical protein